MSHELSIIKQYDTQHTLYSEFCERVHVLLEQLLKNSAISVHSITARMKTRESCLKKVAKKGASYSTIGDITDIAGIRVIAYFSDQVDEIAKMIKNEFDVDIKNSIDKRAILDPDRFCYLSLHYVVSLSSARCAFPEYNTFTGLKAEIQIRSILQHAWAEIEHDLGYKTSGEVPRSARRQFARLAGLLELADDEFVKIRSDLDAYSREVSVKIVQSPRDVSLDRISLIDFARADSLVRSLDSAIAANLGFTIQRNEDSIAGNVEKLHYFGLQTIEDLKSALVRHQHNIIRLSEHWAPSEKPVIEKGTLSEGISFFYLCHILAGANQNNARIISYLEKFEIGNDEDCDSEDREEIARDLIEFMKDDVNASTIG
jgi:putative GTP pyrophosphokinase